MATVTVEVTQADINRGEKGRCRTCPVALAIQRVIVPTHAPEVFGDYLFLREVLYVSNKVELRLPDEVPEFIDAFDDEDAVWPFTFSLDVPDDLVLEARP